LDSQQWWELIGSPMCAPSSDKTSFCGRFESVFMDRIKSFKQTKDGADFEGVKHPPDILHTPHKDNISYNMHVMIQLLLQTAWLAVVSTWRIKLT
jgi:hypothetical protein